MNRPRLSLDLDAVAHNVSRWRGYVGGREVWAVVKSDAYGLGALAVARACLAAGAARLVVFDIDEARALRSAGITAPIVQVFATPADALPDAFRLGVVPSVQDEAGAVAFSAVAEWRGRRAAVHVAVDTGTGWSGVPSTRAGAFAQRVCGLPGVEWEGAWTHIAGKDSVDAQMRAFATAVASMRAEGLSIPVLHAASTGPALWGVSTGAVRVGVGLFGSTLGEPADGLGLRTALRLTASVIAIKRFDESTPLGYGGNQRAEPGETIATLRIGYADGLPRGSAENAGVALLGGERCALAGAIGMNCTMARIPASAGVRIGDESLMLGEAPGVRIDDVSRAAGVLPHALIAGLCAALRPVNSGALS